MQPLQGNTAGLRLVCALSYRCTPPPSVEASGGALHTVTTPPPLFTPSDLFNLGFLALKLKHKAHKDNARNFGRATLGPHLVARVQHRLQVRGASAPARRPFKNSAWNKQTVPHKSWRTYLRMSLQGSHLSARRRELGVGWPLENIKPSQKELPVRTEMYSALSYTARSAA